MVATCDCELLNDKLLRTKCFLKHYNFYLGRRQKKQLDENLYINLTQINIEINNSTLLEELCEGVILKQFLKKFCETHPQYSREFPIDFGPNLEFYTQL